MPIRLALKVDVDTDRGTRVGVPNLVSDLQVLNVPACFLFSLGPDQTGRAITRVLRPGFFKKVSRTSVVEIYGAHRAHHVGIAPPNVRRGQQRAIEQRAHAIAFDHTGAADFLKKTRPQHPCDRSAGLIRAERKQEASRRV